MLVDEKASVEACNALIAALKDNGLQQIGYGGVTYAVLEAYEAAKSSEQPDGSALVAELARLRDALVFECTTATDGNYVESMVLVRAADINKVTSVIYDLGAVMQSIPERESSGDEK